VHQVELALILRELRMKSWGKNSPGAFTLVELLVVIAIIALLLSILMPALNSARDQAKGVVCMSNVKQIGLASVAYRTEYKGYYPPSNYTPHDYYTNPSKYRPWYNYATWFYFLKPYVIDTASKVNMCPSLSKLFISQKLSYSFNVEFGYCLNEDGTWSGPLVKDSQVKAVADKILIIEGGPSYCNDYYVYENGSTKFYPPEVYAYRLYPINNWHYMRMSYEFTPGAPASTVHGGKLINSVYADGHAQKDYIVNAMDPKKWFPLPERIAKDNNPWGLVKGLSSRPARFPQLNPATP
jgi:prepilin-type N-terminal cleavage/methylation domain-containing protein/prepilin-type processing-associated H-X9-DG protein